LSKAGDIEKAIDDEKLTEKAKRLLTSEKKARRDKDRVPYEEFSLNFERQLRKVATRGVVKFFNAAQQKKQSAASTNKVKHTPPAFLEYIQALKEQPKTQRPKQDEQVKPSQSDHEEDLFSDLDDLQDWDKN
jgi:hypothetical protein